MSLHHHLGAKASILRGKPGVWQERRRKGKHASLESCPYKAPRKAHPFGVQPFVRQAGQGEKRDAQAPELLPQRRKPPAPV